MMPKILSYLFLVITLFLVKFTNGQEEIQCLGQDLNMTNTQLKVVTDCLREAKIVSVWKIPIEKISCFGICILEKKKLLNAKGGLDHDQILKYIMDVLKPDKVKKPIVEGVEKCIKDHGTKVRQPNDPNCLEFNTVGLCVHDVFLEACVEG